MTGPRVPAIHRDIRAATATRLPLVPSANDLLADVGWDALSSSPWLHDEDQKLIDAVLDSLLVEDAQAYREATGAQVVESEPYRGSVESGRDLPAPEGGEWS